MAYDQHLAERIREAMMHLTPVEEKEMMGGLSFLYNKKMCVGIIKDEMMCRIHPDAHEAAVEQSGCRAMDFTGRPMRGWVMIDQTAIKSKKQLDYWIGLAVAYNTQAKSGKKKK